MSDVPFEALAADAAAGHSAEHALLRLPGVVTVEITGRHALKHVDLNEHVILLSIVGSARQLVEVVTETGPVNRFRRSLAHVAVERLSEVILKLVASWEGHRIGRTE